MFFPSVSGFLSWNDWHPCNHIIFQKSVDNFEIAHKVCSILVWLQFPLNLEGCPLNQLDHCLNLCHSFNCSVDSLRLSANLQLMAQVCKG